MEVSITKELELAGKFFMGKSSVHAAARKITAALREMRIPFVIEDGLALGAHGHRRMTEDVDLLLTREGLEAFKKRWLGLGWVEKFPGSKGLRDVENDVKIDVLLAGDFPGDGKPKSIAFPDPSQVDAVAADEGYPTLPLRSLLELKIASGITASHRPQDFADAIQLIKKNKLPAEYGQQLNPYVHEKYAELWKLAQVEEDY